MRLLWTSTLLAAVGVGSVQAAKFGVDGVTRTRSTIVATIQPRTAAPGCSWLPDILSWSRSQGLFAGVALEGATLREDLDDNGALYGKKLENRAIVTTGVRAPKAAAKLLDLLNRYSAKEHTD
jgi:lipid-binding SYLF domain-containing protein